jgi:transposase
LNFLDQISSETKRFHLTFRCLDLDSPVKFELLRLLKHALSENNRVRAIDVYVNTLERQGLGVKYTNGVSQAGQPPYPPQAMLKLYLYGYIQGIRSSRKLESETHRNLEVIWLIECLRPSYKSIADFRKHRTHHP